MTAIILSFAAGGLIKLNLGEEKTHANILSWSDDVRYRAYGWPLVANILSDAPRPILLLHPKRDVNFPSAQPVTPQPAVQAVNMASPAFQFQDFIPTPPRRIPTCDWKLVCADVAIALLLLGAVAMVCELLLRRRYAQSLPGQ